MLREMPIAGLLVSPGVLLVAAALTLTVLTRLVVPERVVARAVGGPTLVNGCLLSLYAALLVRVFGV